MDAALKDAAVGRMQSRDLLPYPLPAPPSGVVHKRNNIIDRMADDFSVMSDTRTIQPSDDGGLVFARKDPDSPTGEPRSGGGDSQRSFDARLPV